MEPINKDDITVTKSYTEFSDDDPGIEYYIRHWSETPQTVEIRERVPESADIDTVESHASGDLAWEKEGRELVFRHRIDTDGVTTAYTYTEELKNNLSEWMGEPDIEVIDDSDEAETEASAESVTTGEEGAASAESGAESTVDDESSGPNVAEIADAIEDMAGDGNIAVGDDDSSVSDEATAANDEDMAASDENSTTNDEDVAASDENSTTNDEDVATSEETATSNDDSAASDADSATGDEDDDEGIGNVGAALNTRFGEHDERIEELLDRAEAHEAEIDALKNTTKDHGETITALTERTSQNETDIADIADDIEGVADSLGELSDEVDDRFEAADEQRDALAARIDDHADQLSDLAGDIESVSEDVATLEARLDDDGDIGERIDDLEAEINEFAQWREQIASTLMSVGGDDR
ncbi:MAG: hypothetical protein ABEH61_00400 [Haloarculaceae archaeon]